MYVLVWVKWCVLVFFCNRPIRDRGCARFCWHDWGEGYLVWVLNK